ncbi:MAG TPA: general secretion pathway protein GspB [Steroidobacteraceae bacterium]
MSFILDALKKSEIERQRQIVPGLMDARSAQRRSRLPVWAIAVGALLGVNLIVLLVVLTQKGAKPAASAPASTAAVSSARNTQAAPDLGSPPRAAGGGEPAASAAQHFSPLDNTPVYAPEIPVPPADAAALRPTPAPAPAAAAAAVQTWHRPDPVLTDSDNTAASEEVLPTLSEIHLTGSQALPELHLDVHVYATQPAERFVYINMHKYHEGSVLEEGPTVERIRRDGVVLSYHGLRFLLPRQ